jgi:hypothetical protein
MRRVEPDSSSIFSVRSAARAASVVWEEPRRSLLPPIEITRHHRWKAMHVVPLILGNDGLLHRDYSQQAVTNVGCFECDMSFDEGKDVNCPGFDLFSEDQMSPEP